MNRKVIAAMTTMGLLFSSATIQVPLLESSVYASTESTKQLKEQLEKGIKKELKLEDILTLAIEDNRNLARLYYSKKLIELNEEDLIVQRRDLQSDLSDLQKKRSDAVSGKSAYTTLLNEAEEALRNAEDAEDEDAQTDAAAAIKKYEEDIKGIEDGIKQLDDSIKRLNDSIDSINKGLIEIQNQIDQNPLQHEKVKQGVSLMVTSTFIQLQGLQEGIAFQEILLKQSQDELRRQERLVKIGLMANNNMSSVKRAIARQQQELENSKEDYDIQLTNLLLDLGIDSYSDNITIKKQSLDTQSILAQKETTKKLIEKNIDIRLLKQDLVTLEKMRDQSSGNAREQKKVEIDLKNLDIKDKELELEKKISELYLEASKSYNAVKQAEQDLQFEKNDYEKLKLQYNLGLISQFDFNSAGISINEKEMELMQVQMAYFMVVQQIKALENGFIS